MEFNGESVLHSQIRTEGDYCNELRGRLGVCMDKAMVQTRRVGWSFGSQTSTQGTACPDLISDIFENPSEN